MIRIAIVLCAFAAVALGQTPRPCVAPSTMEGRIQVFDVHKNFFEYQRFHYDGLNRRVRVFDEIFINKTKLYKEVLYLFREQREYEVDSKSRHCTERALSREWRPLEIPINATFHGEAYIGSSVPTQGVLVQNWEGKDRFGESRHIWTYPFCIPVTNQFFNKNLGFVDTTFTDITIGISDPNIFEIPKECRK